MELSRPSRLGRRAFSALAGTTVLGLALGGSTALPASGSAGPAPSGPPPGPPGADGARHRVTLKGDSLLVDGRRLALWSGELHPFRLPSPSLWRDVLQKMRAYGHNAVDVRLAWNQHSPPPARTTSPVSATSTCSCARPPSAVCTSSCTPARTSAPTWTPGACPAG